MSENQYTIDGVTKTSSEWCQHFGVNIGAVRARLHLGWDVEKAFSTPVRFRYRTFTIDGVTKTLGDWCKTTGIDFKLANNRLKQGRSIEEAILNVHYPRGPKATAKPKREKLDKQTRLRGQYGIEMDGQTKTIREWCEEYNIDYVVVKQRYYLGWELRDALTRPVRTYNK
jgi:hypothetical protein